ncbi:Glutamate decarboxylase 5 (GAD 5) [Durusdinium trenchii]|uniref:Glutamate decarboxylase n=1 Tax=Durusdinium trenchii TaxID=1381693 RepID=A0ABP0IEH0_9DINO
MKEVYATEMAVTGPSEEMPAEGMSARGAATIIKDELLLDGNPLMNLATFVTTYLEPEAEEIMRVGSRINIIDQDEYPQSAEIHRRCVNMVGKLWHAETDENGNVCGSATVGSSEAIMLAGLAMKFRWRAERKAKGLPVDRWPNMVFGSNVQCCWHKMCRFFDIEMREADVSEDSLVLTAERAKPLIDEYTMGVGAILGSTFNGEFEDIKGINDMIEELNREKGWNVALHVDAASGGFIAPFTTPDLVWDFQLSQVVSINTSGHKFGLTTAGLGWVAFKNNEVCPEDLFETVDYLGGSQRSIGINFSKPASQILCQYYQLIRLGKEGYSSLLRNQNANAQHMRNELAATGIFEIVDKGDMPLVAFKMMDPIKAGFTLYDLQAFLSARGWTMPAYRCPKGAENLVIMRAVIKQNLSRNMVHMLINTIKEGIEFYASHPTHLLHPKNEDLLDKLGGIPEEMRDDQTQAEAKAVDKPPEPPTKHLGRPKLSRSESSRALHSASHNVVTELVGGNAKRILSFNTPKPVC